MSDQNPIDDAEPKRREKLLARAEKKRQRSAQQTQEESQARQELGKIPKIKDRKRRAAGIGSLVEFCNIYLAPQFSLPWSKYHFAAAARIERAIEFGGLYSFAMPRGSGKTTLSRAAVLWAVLSGKCKCVVLLSATETSAEKHLKQGLKKTLLRNKLLLEDFPHAIYPFRHINGESRGAAGQLYKGEKTFVEWAATHVTFAWIPKDESLSNGAVIETMGMTGEIRGPLYTLPDGTQVRPQLVLADDPQTRESSRSFSQSQSRFETLAGDVAYLAGPGSQIAVVCPCTVIHKGDLADQLLDRELHPEWQGERTKMVESFPVNLKKWDEYAAILKQCQRDDEIEKATEMYQKNRIEMDEGAVVSWPERRLPFEISGIQHAMNLKIRDEPSFYAECQNEPMTGQDDMQLLSVDEICNKMTNHPRGIIPADVSTLTAFTDVQQNYLFWMICGWSSSFSGHILDYGAWPTQDRMYFTRKDARPTLYHEYSGDESGIIFGVLSDLGEHICGPRYVTEDGRELSIDKWGIDGGWADRVPGTEFYVNQSPYKKLIAITKGFGVKATGTPMSLSKRAVDQRIGPFEWYWRDGKKDGGWISFNTNFWKSRIHAGLSISTGSRSSITLFKASPYTHRMLAEHLRAEAPIRVAAKGTTVIEWQEIPGKENEGFDTLVGCALMASVAGVRFDSEAKQPGKKPRMSLANMAAKARGEKMK